MCMHLIITAYFNKQINCGSNGKFSCPAQVCKRKPFFVQNASDLKNGRYVER